jgi:hypothetical protein
MQDSAINMIKALQNSIDVIGVDATIQSLNSVNPDKKTYIKNFIINEVCRKFDVSKEITEKNIHTLKHYKSLAAISYLLYHFVYYTQAEVGYILGKSKSTVNRYITEIVNLDRGYKEDKQVLEIVKNLELKISKLESNGKKR